ncbi:MAG: DUF3656 domain-containing protein, partial [Trueperaceae bacterium]
EQTYSRGLGPWFVAGTDHRTVVRGRAPRHRGLRLGTVVRILEDAVVVAPAAAVEPPGPALADLRPAARSAAEAAGRAPRPGDGLVFDAAHRRSPALPEQGGRVYRVAAARDGWRLAFGRGDVDLCLVRPGDAVWRSDDPTLAARARRFTEAAEPVRTDALSLVLTAHEGAPLVLVATTARGETAVAVGDAPLERAANRALDHATARTQLGRLGGTPFHLGDLTLDAEGAPFAPVSALNALRRELVAQLVAVRAARPERHARGGALADARAALGAAAPAPVAADAPSRLHALVRTPEQLDAALAAHAEGVPLASVTLDYLELYGLRPSVERARAAGLRVRVASPRVLKPAEQNVVRFLTDLGAELLVRSAGLLRDLTALPAGARPRITGDFSLNATNALTAHAFLAAGCDALTPAYDLDAAQVAALASAIDPRRLEVVVHHHLPVFHTEHCVFCRFLSDGHDHTDCGHPCESHRVALRDGQGRLHPVLADVGCRNTVFGAEAQVAAKHWPRWRAAGFRDARVEFVHEDGDAVRAVLAAWRGVLDAPAFDPARLEARLRAAAPEGVTEGSYFVPHEGMRALPVL